MFRSLRSRLVTVTVLVALAAIVAVWLVSMPLVVLEFRNYVSEYEASQVRQAASELAEKYRIRNRWDDVQQDVDRFGALVGTLLVLIDSDGNVVAAYPERLRTGGIQTTSQGGLTWTEDTADGDRLRRRYYLLEHVPNQAIVSPSGVVLGTLYHGHLPSSAEPDAGSLFARATLRNLSIAALISMAVALGCAFVLSNRLLQPISALTRAVRALEAGDLDQRVDTAGRDEIGDLTRAFNEMAASRSRAEQLRRNLVDDVAHELRTPLASIRCQLEMVQDGLAIPDPQRIQSLLDETLRLGAIVNDLQDLALAEAGQLRLSIQRLAVADEIQSVIDAFAPKFADAGISVAVDVPERVPQVLADPNRLRQVLANLLTNSLAHTARGGTVVVGACEDGISVSVWVRDTGCGMAEDFVPLAFERFRRADTSRDRATGGTGLGLSIVKQIVSAHGGEVYISSRLGEGTEVTFTLPQTRREHRLGDSQDLSEMA